MGTMKHGKLPEEQGYRLFLLLALLFAGITAIVQPIAGILEALAAVGCFLILRRIQAKREKEVMAYLESMSSDIEAATRGTIVNAPLPVALFQPETDDIIWTNDRFLEMTGNPDHLYDTKMSSVVPSFQQRWITEGEQKSPTSVTVRDHKYMVFGNLIDTDSQSGRLAMTYWLDITQYDDRKQRFEESRPVCAIILIDNYEDLMRGLEDSERAVMLSDLNKKISQWAEPAQGILCRYDRDHYIFVFEQRHLEKFMAGKFALLESVRQLRGSNEITATVSIGIGKEAEQMRELFQRATLSMEMALSRGGDQVVIKDADNFYFYGGKARESERRTKVKSRVVANALSELLSSSTRIFIMGHKCPDFDCIGACAGMVAIARKKGIPAYVIREREETPGDVTIKLLESLPAYEEVFIYEEEAMDLLDQNDVVVVVDTNRPEQAQAQQLLERCGRMVVIDHHRRAKTYIDIEKTDLSFQDIYASSASELVVELVQYILGPGDLKKQEAEAILAGIMLDTKNFTLRTGSRTFEAAAYLRRAGADTAQVRRFFQANLEQTLYRFGIVQHARLYHGQIALAVSDRQVDRVTAAKAADELLNISGVGASFVLVPSKGQTVISARSAGEINVQLIVEKLGGGGNSAAAGVQLSGVTPEAAAEKLQIAIDAYFAENDE